MKEVVKVPWLLQKSEPDKIGTNNEPIPLKAVDKNCLFSELFRKRTDFCNCYIAYKLDYEKYLSKEANLSTGYAENRPFMAVQ
jgi:hypothetical protein